MVSRTLRHRRRSIKNRIIATTVLTVFLGALFGFYLNTNSKPVTESVPVFQSTAYWSSSWPKWQDALFYGIPGFNQKKEVDAGIQIKKEISFQYILRSMVFLLTSVDIKDVRTVMAHEIAATSLFKPAAPTVSAVNMPNFPVFDDKASLAGGKVLVGIYHTHTAESFIPDSGATHKPGGQVGDIADVGEALVKHLEKQKIKAIQSKNIHDYPSFMKAYEKSEGTVKTMLAENPSIQMIFDIHRDADKRENCVAVVHGITVAKITIIVATGQQDLVQTHWQQNYAFAKLIDAKLNQRFPGLSKGIQLVEWRYNQQLHPRALLLEVGCQENSKEEAIHSIEMLGDVLADIIVENTQP